MITRMYVVYDRVVKETGFPFDAKNDGVACRKFKNMIDQMKVNPDEFELYYIGDYDNEQMVIKYENYTRVAIKRFGESDE